MAEHYVYIMTNRSGTLYVGMTDDLPRRVYEHKHRLLPGFTAEYHIDKLVYYEPVPDRHEAIMRERQIKGWLRSRKLDLIKTLNPQWKDLSLGLLGPISEDET